MRTAAPSWSVCRAVIAVAALYALVLQVFLGGLQGADTLNAAHALCMQNTGSTGEGPAQAPPPHQHLACCTAAHVAPNLDAPGAVMATIVWPVRRAIIVLWRPEVVAAGVSQTRL